MLPGVYVARKKDGSVYYRASITYKNKHISLGSYEDEFSAHLVYTEAGKLLADPGLDVESFDADGPIPFKKWVVLINFRDNGMYVKTPILLKERFFYYYFNPGDYLIFDIDDLFYYSTHSIMRRGGHLFVADFGMQVNILSRYGIKNFAVPGRDYIFLNGNSTDFRSSNLKIINRYNGVRRIGDELSAVYEARIHVNGDMIIGRYKTEEEAAVAYNKAAQTLIKNGIVREYQANYLEELSSDEYRELYKDVKISKRIKGYER
ncbi:MAG: hypothetical protein IJ807_03600 [Eubacterium sp.]|nr:hypothetical protein [Eubacterium sp.]